MIGTADFSPCGTYRYGLTRRWDEHAPSTDTVLWLMLNPSTADAHVLDPTIRRCVGFSQLWGYGGLEVANLFALRSTDPSLLYGAERDPVGPRNDAAIIAAARRCELIVVAWGVHGALHRRGDRVLALLAEVEGCVVRCLGTTKHGHPKHPLYVAAATAPRPFPLPARSPDARAALLAPPEAAP